MVTFVHKSAISLDQLSKWHMSTLVAVMQLLITQWELENSTKQTQHSFNCLRRNLSRRSAVEAAVINNLTRLRTHMGIEMCKNCESGEQNVHAL